MLARVLLAVIGLIGLSLVAMATFGIGGAFPGWALLIYIPFLFIGVAVFKWIAIGFGHPPRR